jgi:single-strand DNA-binding protein
MINSVILVGRLTADPQLRYLPNGTPVASYSLAVQNPFKKNDDGKPTADFINVVTFGQQAENLVKYKKKGSLIGVEGRIQTRKWQDKQGNNRYVTEVVTNHVTFLVFDGDSKSQDNAGSEQQLNMASDSDDLPF